MISRNPVAGQTEARRIVSVSHSHTDRLLAMTLCDAVTGQAVETIEATRQHPFYVEGKGFVAAAALGIGNAIVTRAGPPLVVGAMAWERRAEGYDVYNLIVEGDHTYFVGDTSGGVWVHNGMGPTCATQSVPRADFEVTSNGTAIPTSKGELEQGFKKAGFNSYPSAKTGEAGTNYIDPANGRRYRVMDGSSAHGPRLMTHAPAGNTLLPSGANLPNGNLGKVIIRKLTHFPLEP